MAEHFEPVGDLAGHAVSLSQRHARANEVKTNKTKDERKRGKLLITGILLCSGLTQPLQAAEFAYGVGYMGEHSDNITRVPTDERSDWIHSLLAGFAYRENSANVDAHVLAQATYNTYQNNSFDNKTWFDLNSSAVWTISPKRFLWTVEDYYQQGLLDPTAADTPTNRTNINVLSTGPDFFLRLAPVHTLNFGVRAGDVYTGRANADNKRLYGLAGWSYRSTPVTTLSLNYQILDVRYDDTILNDNFTSQDLFFRAQFQPSRSQYILDLGTTHINPDRGDNLRGPRARLSFIRHLTLQSTFGASVSKEFSNLGTDILAGSTIASPTAEQVTTLSGISQSIVTGDIYETKSGLISYNLRGTHLGTQFQAGQRKLDFVTTPLDRKETNGHLQIDYYVSAVTTATLFGDYTKTEYFDFFRRDTDQYAGLRFGYRFTRTVSAGLEGRRTVRHSTDPTAEFVDHRLVLTLLYSSRPLFTPVLHPLLPGE